ncbi:Iron-binding protein IscA [Candidatus Profftia lariciata]|uniref:iron-sulfur cluster assembly accessory protein n=1 Tax=Candidatus Profftia lariciata TaxID=1987921 RepID=UPI001D02175C|nr:iron-sulfur cluster assembly accessory protein [Candidatus Profftia lariciata]UDG81801.1 Iron-binding protein IscA [Candidatus Profftia lariciata]
MSISLSKSAAQRIKMLLANHSNSYGLRIGVKNSGCSGMAYVLEVIDVLNECDVVFEDQGVKVIVDDKNLAYLNGIEIDFIKEELNERFKFYNPNIISECGCGASFSV